MTKKLEAIPLPTTPLPRPTPVRTKRNGLGWNPRTMTTKTENVALFHYGRYNRVLAGKSILYQVPKED